MPINWDTAVAGRVKSIQPSVFVDLDDIWSVDDLIFFAGGTPPAEQVPYQHMQCAMDQAWEEAPGIYGYGDAQGYEPLRQFIAERMASRDAESRTGDILITNGSQQGLDLTAKILFDAGDTVLVEGPTYFGALQAFDAYRVQYQTIPIDEQGIIPGELERAIHDSPAPKALYTVSIFQNPTGVTISRQRQQQILDICRAAGVVVIEDDPYGELQFDRQVRPPLRALDPDVIYLGTFSKTLYPALRMGWMVMPDAIRAPLVDAKEAVDIQSDRFIQRAVSAACEDGWYERHLIESRELYRARCQCMLAALEREMPPGVSWSEPDGGFFIWLTLPATSGADELLPVAARNGVGFLPGSFFFPDRRNIPALRLGFSTLAPETIDEGIRRLGIAVRELNSVK